MNIKKLVLTTTKFNYSSSTNNILATEMQMKDCTRILDISIFQMTNVNKLEPYTLSLAVTTAMLYITIISITVHKRTHSHKIRLTSTVGLYQQFIITYIPYVINYP